MLLEPPTYMPVASVVARSTTIKPSCRRRQTLRTVSTVLCGPSATNSNNSHSLCDVGKGSNFANWSLGRLVSSALARHKQFARIFSPTPVCSSNQQRAQQRQQLLCCMRLCIRVDTSTYQIMGYVCGVHVHYCAQKATAFDENFHQRFRSRRIRLLVCGRARVSEQRCPGHKGRTEGKGCAQLGSPPVASHKRMANTRTNVASTHERAQTQEITACYKFLDKSKTRRRLIGSAHNAQRQQQQQFWT